MDLYQNSTLTSTMKTTENLKPKMVAPKQFQNWLSCALKNQMWRNPRICPRFPDNFLESYFGVLKNFSDIYNSNRIVVLIIQTIIYPHYYALLILMLKLAGTNNIANLEFNNSCVLEIVEFKSGFLDILEQLQQWS